PISANVTCPLVLMVAPSRLAHAMRFWGSNIVVSASHSTLLPSGPSITQWVEPSARFSTDLMFFMKLGKFSKFDHASKTSSTPAPTMMLLVACSAMNPPPDETACQREVLQPTCRSARFFRVFIDFRGGRR